MGGAFIGVADDYSASFWNPAGLAQLRRLEFTGGISSLGVDNKAGFLGSSQTSSMSSTGLNDLGFVFPFPTVQGSLVFSFGYNRLASYSSLMQFDGFNSQSSIIPTLYQSDGNYDVPYNIYLENQNGYTPIKGNVQQTGTVKESGNLGQWSFAGAIDIEENISFGIGLNIVTGSYKYTRNYLEADVQNVYANSQASLPADSAYLRFNKFYYDNFLDADVSGGGLTFGLMYRSDIFRVGLIAKTPTSVTVKESYRDEGQSVFDNAGTFATAPKTTYTTPNSTNTYGVSSPWTLGAGFSAYVLPTLLLTGDIEYVDWTQLEWTDNIDLEKTNASLQSQLRSVTTLRVGAEFDVPLTDIRLRAGYAQKPSPYKADPSSYDNKMLTAGAGILLQRNVLLDAAIGFGNWKTYRTNYGNSASRTDEALSTMQMNFTISYRF